MNMETVQVLPKKIEEVFFESCKSKRYCILIFLDDIVKIKEFNIDKKGFGMQCAWLIVDDIEKIKKH